MFEEKLGKLREKIWETKLRLDALRDRRKKLLLISARDRLIEYPCPCYPGNSTERERATRASTQKGGEKPEDNSEDEGKRVDKGEVTTLREIYELTF